MFPLNELVKLFDLLANGGLFDVQPPTDESIEHINRHFGISLPESLIEFAKRSKQFGTWFASLGEDYNNPFHIIRINRLFKRMRRQAHGDKWRPAKPKAYILINHGHDDDCDCLDAANWNKESGEYQIVYWYPGIKEIEERYKSFSDYIEAFVLNKIQYHYDNKNSSGQLRRNSREMVKEIDKILSQI